MSSSTKGATATKIKIDKPKLYKVILLNDDYTTMEFVVEVIVKVFHKSHEEAEVIMQSVHQNGKGIVGTYTYDIAITKSMQVQELAKQKEFPLKSIVEEV